MFNNHCNNLYRYDDNNDSMRKLNECHESMSSSDFSAISLGEYIYVFNQDRSLYRLEYCDVLATWEKMNNWIGDHGDRPPVVTSSNAIYLVSTWSWQHTNKTSKSVSTYSPSSDQWERLHEKPTSTNKSALLCCGQYLYCFGGLTKHGFTTNNAERMDIATMEWTRIAPMERPRRGASAAQYEENIYVVGGDRESARELSDTESIEMYNPKAQQWTGLKPIDPHRTYIKRLLRSFHISEIDGSLFSVGCREIVKYDIRKNTWEIVTCCEDMDIAESVLLMLSDNRQNHKRA